MSKTLHTEHQLAAASVKRDRDALFEEVVEVLQPGLARLCRGYEADADERQDLLQEILTAIWRSLPKFEQRSSLRTWVYRIAHNVAATHVVKAKRRTRPVKDELTPRTQATAGDEALSRQDELAHLFAAMERLTLMDKQLLMLWMEDIPIREIATITGLTHTNVSSRLHRAREQLRKLLEAKHV